MLAFTILFYISIIEHGKLNRHLPYLFGRFFIAYSFCYITWYLDSMSWFLLLIGGSIRFNLIFLHQLSHFVFSLTYHTINIGYFLLIVVRNLIQLTFLPKHNKIIKLFSKLWRYDKINQRNKDNSMFFIYLNLFF